MPLSVGVSVVLNLSYGQHKGRTLPEADRQNQFYIFSHVELGKGANKKESPRGAFLIRRGKELKCLHFVIVGNSDHFQNLQIVRFFLILTLLGFNHFQKPLHGFQSRSMLL